MASWLNPCSYDRPVRKPNKPRALPASRWSPLLWLALASAGCGRAAPPAATVLPEAGTRSAPQADTKPANAQVLCSPAASGRLQAKLQGAIDAELSWAAPDQAQCLGGPRPTGDGVRLLYKGDAAGAPLLVVIGIGALTQGASGRNLPVNLTLIREGTGQFFATQGDDKCALDSLEQAAIEGSKTRFQLTGRGYCTQPARALGGGGAVLVSRFDVEALVDYPEAKTE